GHPADDIALESHGGHDGERHPERRDGGEGPVRQQPVETDRHAEPRDRVEGEREQDVREADAVTPRQVDGGDQAGERRQDDRQGHARLHPPWGGAGRGVAARERLRAVIVGGRARSRHSDPFTAEMENGRRAALTLLFSQRWYQSVLAASVHEKTPAPTHPLNFRGCRRGPEQLPLDYPPQWPVHRVSHQGMQTRYFLVRTVPPAVAHPGTMCPGGRTGQTGRTCSACGPFGPWPAVNSTRWFSDRLRNPSVWMADWWTKTSAVPSS